MKKLLLILALALSQLTFAQQFAFVDLYVFNASGNPEPNFALTVYDFGSGSGSVATMTTDVNGRAIDSMIIGSTGMLYCDFNINGCSDTVLMNYTPNNGPIVYFSDTLYTCGTSANCSASFIIDSVNSQPGNVVVWNTSVPAYTPSTTTQYLWDFGDGNTSTQAFPTHTYSGAGTYVICLAINVPATPTVPACSSIYCDTLKVDSLGNIIQKSTGASITLNVIDPNTISIEEDDFSTSQVFPNPATDFIQIEIDANSTGDISIELISLSGAIVNSTSSDVNSGLNTLEVDVRDIVSGIYFIKISKDGTSHFEKVIIQ